MEIFVESDSGAAAAAESKGFTLTAERGVSLKESKVKKTDIFTRFHILQMKCQVSRECKTH